jgi:2-hydroxycyclohexanecarboxyl-CoA dehydrogenase
MQDILDLGGRVAVVTGAGQGVGRQIALHLAQAKNSGGVAVNDFYLERAQSVVEEIKKVGGKAVAVQGDVTRIDDVRRFVGEAREKLGKIGILVNNAGNAGINPPAEIRKAYWETGPEVWNQSIGVNLYGVINCCSAVVPDMIERKDGRLITIISDAGRWGDAGLEIYAGAKAGAAGFMRSNARSLGRFMITANCIAIGMTETPAIQRRLDDQEGLKRSLERYIIRRVGQPTDIANMALFLASNASSWITGQTYPVNGGFSLAL